MGKANIIYTLARHNQSPQPKAFFLDIFNEFDMNGEERGAANDLCGVAVGCAVTG
jgi:hypothetical protein